MSHPHQQFNTLTHTRKNARKVFPFYYSPFIRVGSVIKFLDKRHLRTNGLSKQRKPTDINVFVSVSLVYTA